MVKPLIGVVGSPNSIRTMNSGEEIDPEFVPLATGTDQGAMSPAQFTQLDDHETRLDAAESTLTAHTGATDPHSGALPRSGARAMTGALDMGAQAITNVGNVDGRDVSADGAKLDGIAAGAEVNASANVGTLDSNVQVDTFDGESAATQNFRRWRSGRSTRVEASGQLNRVDFDPSFIQHDRGGPVRYTRSGSKVAGATLRPNLTGDVDPAVQNGQVVHDAANLFPFMVWTEVDSYGYPHHLYQQMLNGGVGDYKQSRGYEDGDMFRAGEMVWRPGRGVAHEARGLLQNVSWADAFLEFVLEPNPSVDPAGELEGANRMRFLSGELGFTTTSDVLVVFTSRLLVTSATAYNWEGRIRAYSSSGAQLFSREIGGYTEAGHNWLRDDTKLQLRVRVDRIANVDTYNDDYQGSNQGADLLRFNWTNYTFEPIGFDVEDV